MTSTSPTRISYDWHLNGTNYRYSVWVAYAPYFGWSVMADYGKPGQESVVTSPHTRDACIEHLQRMYVDSYALSCANLTIDEYDQS